MECPTIKSFNLVKISASKCCEIKVQKIAVDLAWQLYARLFLYIKDV
jgi:hypothetical protein